MSDAGVVLKNKKAQSGKGAIKKAEQCTIQITCPLSGASESVVSVKSFEFSSNYGIDEENFSKLLDEATMVGNELAEKLSK